MKLRSLIESSVVFLLAVASASAQNAPAHARPPKANRIPRAPDRHPDLSGIWSTATRTPFERPAVFAGRATISDEEARQWEAKQNERWEDEESKIDGGRPVTIKGGAYNVLFYDNGNELARIGGQKRTSMVVDPPDGHVPPLVPEARDRIRQRRTYVPGDYKTLSNDTRCLVGNTPSVPLVPALYNNNIEIVQSADTILIEVEMIHDARIVHMNAKHRPRLSASGSATPSDTGKATHWWSKRRTSTTRLTTGVLP